MVKQIAQSINRNYRWDFLKVAVCNHSMKGIMTPFIEHPVHGLLSAKGRKWKSSATCSKH